MTDLASALFLLACAGLALAFYAKARQQRREELTRTGIRENAVASAERRLDTMERAAARRYNARVSNALARGR